MARIVNMDNCSGCLLCSLACSFFNTPERSFNLSKSEIRVRRAKGRNRFEVEFSDACSGCETCVDYCHFGVLEAT